MRTERNPRVAEALTRVLGVDARYSSWFVARALLRACWKKRPGVLRDASFDLRELPFLEAARDVLWRRPLENHEASWWIHHYDKNAMYLSACRSVRTGVGDPVHVVDEGSLHDMWGFPGMYRVESVDVSRSLFDGLRFPRIIEDNQQWATWDVVQFALQEGYDFRVQEAWVFQDYTCVLGEWARRLWEARQLFRSGHEDRTGLSADEQREAYAACKDIAVVGNGAWATAKEKLVHADSLDLIHPNWWADVVGKARVNLLANLRRFGFLPVLVRTDGLWYTSSSANWRTALPGILDRMGECGGYKYVESFQLTQQLFRQANAAGLDHAGLSKLFHAAARNDA